MRGLFERAMGSAWDGLHPCLRDRYGVVTADGRQAVGQGEMGRIDRHALAVPALWALTYDDLLFPENGWDVPFTIVTTPFVDGNGNEALALNRRFELDPPRKFVDTLRWNPARQCITDLLGRHGRIAVDIFLNESDGALELTLGDQWIRAGNRYVPLPESCAVTGTLRDWYDDDAEEFLVAARISTPLLGAVFGYEGRFENGFREQSTEQTRPSHSKTPLPGESQQ